jgi:hypothetical protein
MNHRLQLTRLRVFDHLGRIAVAPMCRFRGEHAEDILASKQA